MKRVNQVRTLSHLCTKVRIRGKEIVIDHQILFARLLVIMLQSGNLEQCFQHELTATPTSLFKNEGLRKTDKSSLAKLITEKCQHFFRIGLSGNICVGWRLFIASGSLA